MSKLLALDQSSKISGWAVFDNDTLVKSGVFTATSNDLGKRLMKIKNTIIDLIEQYDIDEVVFEDIQLSENQHNNVLTFKVLAEVIGMLCEFFTEIKMPYEAVLPVVWRKTVGIKGYYRKDQKKNAQEYVLKKYNLSASEDECDAICIGIHKILKEAQEERFDWD